MIPEPRILAICGFDDFHETFVSVAVLPSLYVPVTVSLKDVPLATVGFAGLMAIETNFTLETVSVVDCVSEPQAASIVVVPVAMLSASPMAVIVATDGLEDFQRTCCVISKVELSLKVPVAVNCLLATLVSLAIAPLNSTMPVGASKQFTATGTFSDNSTLDMTQQVLWKSSSPSVATITAMGLADSIATGTTTIEAAWGSLTQSTTLTVSNVKLVSIAIKPANPTVAKGTSLRLTVTGTYSDGSTATLTNVSWKSSKPQIANMRGSGIIHAKKGGTATITATAFGLKATTTLTVSTGTLVSIVITPANTSVAAGTTQQFTATGTFSDGTMQDVTLNAHWSSSIASVATVANAPSVAGLATAYAPGVTTIGLNAHGVTATTSLIVN